MINTLILTLLYIIAILLEILLIGAVLYCIICGLLEIIPDIIEYIDCFKFRYNKYRKDKDNDKH